MTEPPTTPSKYRAMWLFAMFDLPVDSKKARRRYAQFRKALLRAGFSKLQYSVYARFFASEEASEAHRKALRSGVPPEGQVRFLSVTDRQFGKMEVVDGGIETEAEKPPRQVELF